MLEKTQKVLQKFAKYVVQQSRSNLTKQKHNVTKELYNSIGYRITDNKEDVFLKFTMDGYGTFLDKGVKGAKPSLVKRGKQKAPNSPYKYRFKKPPLKSILEWVKDRGIRLRTSDGQFSRGTYKTIAFLLQKRIFAQGIAPSFFFTKPFNAAFKKYPDLIAEAYAEDIGGELEQQFKNFTK